MVKPQRKIPRVIKKKRPLRPSRPSRFTRSRPANFEELRDDLFREAAKLASEDPSQSFAIIINPRASDPNGTVHSFGYPSTEGVVRKFLKDTAPPEEDVEKVDEEEEEEEEDDDDWSKYRWWEDEKLRNSKDPVEIRAALKEMEKLKKQLEILRHFGESETGQGSGSKDDGSKP